MTATVLSQPQATLLAECRRMHAAGLEPVFSEPDMTVVRGLARRGLVAYQNLGDRGWRVQITAAALARPDAVDVRFVWRVIALALVDGTERRLGDCGHSHDTDLEAVRCPWTPTPWPEQCDLLVRQIRNPLLDQERAPRATRRTR